MREVYWREKFGGSGHWVLSRWKKTKRHIPSKEGLTRSEQTFEMTEFALTVCVSLWQAVLGRDEHWDLRLFLWSMNGL